jgi:hypothetical protein
MLSLLSVTSIYHYFTGLDPILVKYYFPRYENNMADYMPAAETISYYEDADHNDFFQ